jgi:cytochrome c
MIGVVRRGALVLAAWWALPAFAQGAPDPLAVCTACHSDAPDATAPSLRGIVGRPAASQPDYHYSGPLRRSGLIWTAENLRAFIIDPQSVVPGTRMPFAGATPQEAARIVARLRR